MSKDKCDNDYYKQYSCYFYNMLFNNNHIWWDNVDDKGTEFILLDLRETPMYLIDYNKWLWDRL